MKKKYIRLIALLVFFILFYLFNNNILARNRWAHKDVLIKSAPKGLIISNVHGDIHIMSVDKKLDAKLINGNIIVDTLLGNADISTTRGNIEVTIFSRQNSTQKKLKYKFNTTIGDVKIFVPENLMVNVNAQIGYTIDSEKNYQIYSDLPLEISETSDWEKDGGNLRKYIYGKYSKDQCTTQIDVKVTNGNIFIQ